MEPIEFAEQNTVFAKDQPEYLPLPACVVGDTTVSCWHLSWRDWFRVLFTRRIWLQLLNFGQPLQPQKLTTEKPIVQVDQGGESG